MTTFSRIGLFAHTEKPSVVETLQALVRYLTDRSRSFVMDEETAALLGKKSVPTVSREELGASCDLVIVVGGDGSLLHASHDIIDSQTPLLGINRGSLGFLTDINPAELTTSLDEIFAGSYTEEKRFLLETTVTAHQKTLIHSQALNEIALLPSMTPQMIDFEVYVDDVFVCRERSDGLIVATPTGSTAYALSGGGPILHPELNAIALVPIFPHTLSSRPIVLNADSIIRIDILDSNKVHPRIASDGTLCLELPLPSTITIRKKKTLLRLIHPLNYNYYAALRNKLHWGKRHYHDA